MDIAGMVSDIKILLGEGVVRLEVTDSDIESLIRVAYKVIKPYISDRKFITIPPNRSIDLTPYKVLDVLRVIPTVQIMNDSPVGSNDVWFDFQVYSLNNRAYFNNKSNYIRNYTVEDYYIPFEFENGILMISQGSAINSVTVECIVDVDLEDLVDERAKTWLFKYSLALCKERVGRIRSKFKSANIPVSIDGDTLLSEAREERKSLEDELSNKDFGQFFVLR